MNEPLVSIIIPVYNGENYLREAIDSAIAQTYSNIEIIVVNDGSNDDGATEKIALSYQDRIRYFNKENGGVATALNLAIQKMEGTYFSWLSHDDMYYPNKIERQMQALYESGNMQWVVQSDYDLLQQNSQLVTTVSHNNTYSMDQLTNSVFSVLQGLVHGCTLLIHKSHFERVGVFDESLISTQDYDLWFRILRNQRSIYIKEPLIIARLHNEQGTHTIISHNPERENLHINFIDNLTQEEMSSMYGSPYNFYHRMCCFFKGGNMNQSYSYANQKFQEANIPENISEQIVKLESYIQEISGNADRICIFCAGEYGIRLYQELRSKLISIDCFSDNNPDKWGYLFDNITCVPPKELEEYKERTLVIVATRTPDEIVDQLRSLDFPYVVTKQEIDGVLFGVQPVKWVTSTNGLDFSSEEAKSLIEFFNQTIFDLCKYYEARLSKAKYLGGLN
ncbi:putative glycosyltransferase EpsJ [compost metagenome]